MFLLVLFLLLNSQRDSFCTKFSCCLPFLSHFVALRKLKLNITVWLGSKTISLMPLESSVFVENCHNELLGYFRKHNNRKTEFFHPDDKILYDEDCADTSHCVIYWIRLDQSEVFHAGHIYLYINITTHVPGNEHRSIDQGLKVSVFLKFSI